MTEHVILVNTDDQETGSMEKIEAHVQGKLHRAFSVFIFNTNGQLLLQQRAIDKYHSGGKWTNTCCSHPRHGEATIDAANRRLMEEMGMKCSLQYAFNFTYSAPMEHGYTENEFDHVYFGISDDHPRINPEEVESYKYMDMNVVQLEINNSPDNYTEWFKICFDLVIEHSNNLFNK